MRKIFLILLALVLTWIIWIFMDHTEPWKQSELALNHMEELGPDTSCTRNIVGIQPYMYAVDYLSEEHYFEKLNGYFMAAKKAGYFGSRTVVLLPEYIGTWLVVAGEKADVVKVATIQSAMALLVASNPVRIAETLFSNGEEGDPLAAGIFRMKSGRMATTYGSVFKRLASKYRVTIVAGSIVLPAARVENNEIIPNPSLPLYNTSFIFGPSGDIHPQAVRKVFPITSELSFTQPGSMEDWQAFYLPIGKTAVLVCADSWYPDSYNQVTSLEVEVVLVPSFCSGNDTMSKVWRGYDGSETPSDVHADDLFNITEREAWIKYALPGRLKPASAMIGANIFLRGELWDLGADGDPFFVYQGKLLKSGISDRAGIWNFCF